MFRLVRLSSFRARPVVRLDIIRKKQDWTQVPDERHSVLREFYAKRQKEERCLFPLVQKVNLITNHRNHIIDVSCDRVISLIKIGAINKNIANQYCHYLIHLSRTVENQEDAIFFRNKALDLFGYLFRRDIPLTSKSELLCDISSLGAKLLTDSCDLAMNSKDLWDNLSVSVHALLLNNCYKFRLWELADKLIDSCSGIQFTNQSTLESLSGAMRDTLEDINKNDCASHDRNIKDTLTNHLLKVLEACYKNRVKFSLNDPQSFVETLRKLGITVELNPTIKHSGRCTCCRSVLPSFDQTKLKSLNQSIGELLRVKYSDSSFLNTTPGELERFMNFVRLVSAKKPFDCVIDGLNIASRRNDEFTILNVKLDENIERSYKKQNPASLSTVLVNSIIRGKLTQTFRSVLVIGKQHMYSWPGLRDFFEKHDVAYFFSKDTSKDDLFMLYAATLNPKAVLVSCDFFRDHLAKLDPEQQEILERWLDTHQAWVSIKTLKTTLPTPVEKLPSTDRTNNTFHIPLVDKIKSEKSIASNNAPPNLNHGSLTWVCCRLGTEKSIIK